MTRRSIRQQREQREAERDMVDRFDDYEPAFIPRVPLTSNWSAEQ